MLIQYAYQWLLNNLKVITTHNKTFINCFPVKCNGAS